MTTKIKVEQRCAYIFVNICGTSQNCERKKLYLHGLMHFTFFSPETFNTFAQIRSTRA